MSPVVLVDGVGYGCILEVDDPNQTAIRVWERTWVRTIETRDGMPVFRLKDTGTPVLRRMYRHKREAA